MGKKNKTPANKEDTGKQRRGNERSIEDEMAMNEGKPPEPVKTSKEDDVEINKEEQSEIKDSQDVKTENDFKDTEGTSKPTKVDGEDVREEERSNSRWVSKKPRTSRPIQPESKQKHAKSGNKSSKTKEKQGKKKKSKARIHTPDEQSSDEIEDKPNNDVKQFSFPHFKILSGATIAPVKMHAQSIVIQRLVEEDQPKHWTEGLFQPTQISLRLRLLRLLLVWLFFRVLNKQTGWLSDKLGIGLGGDHDPPPPRSDDPDDRYVRVYHEDSPQPIHVRFKRQSKPGSNDGF